MGAENQEEAEDLAMRRLSYRQYLSALILGLAIMLTGLLVSLWLMLYDNGGSLRVLVFAPLTIVVVVRIVYLVWFEVYPPLFDESVQPTQHYPEIEMNKLL